MDPCLKEAKEDKRTVLFLDAAHFVHAPFIGFVWCLVRVIIKAPSGRQRFNVLGAINAVTLELITVVNATYINANSICELFKKIKKRNKKTRFLSRWGFFEMNIMTLSIKNV